MDFKQRVGRTLSVFNPSQVVSEFFALDVGTTAVRVIELAQKSPTEWNLMKFAVTPIDAQLSSSDAPGDKKRLGDAILECVKASGIVTKNVAVGLPSQKVFSTVIEVADVPRGEIAASINYQAENYIPTAPEETKIDWAVLGPSMAKKKDPNDRAKLEVLIASVTNDYTERQMEFLEGLGFNVVAFEPDPVALTRALLPRNITSNHVIVDVGDFATDVVLTTGENPRLLRSLSFGMKSIVRTLAGGLGITEPEAEQYLYKFGFDAAAMDGKIMSVLNNLLSQFGAEFSKTVHYVRDKYPGMTVDSTLLSGYAVLIPHFADLAAAKFGGTVNFATPWQNIIVPPEYQEQVAPISAQMAVACGLAEREAR
jgi:type IV pilus assembly protein PilM